MSATGPVGEIFAAFTEALAHVATTDLGERELPANTDAPRYIIVPIGGPLTGKQIATGRNLVTTMDLTVEVHCWGRGDDEAASHEAAYRLFQALVTVIPEISRGRNMLIGTLAIGKPAWIESGISYVLPIMFRVPIPRATIPTVGEDQPPTDEPVETVQITDDQPETPAVSTAGDGVLEGAEEW